MIRAVARQYFTTSRVQPRHPHRVFIGIGTTIGEKHISEVFLTCGFDNQPRQFTAGIVSKSWRNRTKLIRLILDGLHQRGVLMP